MNIHPNLKKNEEWMWERLKVCGVNSLPYEIETHDVFANEYTDYASLMPFSYGALKFHGRYEGKVWNYIKDNLETFRPYINEKSLFWIVGAEPKNPGEEPKVCAGTNADPVTSVASTSTTSPSKQKRPTQVSSAIAPKTATASTIELEIRARHNAWRETK
jgi:hypothetical protein